MTLDQSDSPKSPRQQIHDVVGSLLKVLDPSLLGSQNILNNHLAHIEEWAGNERDKMSGNNRMQVMRTLNMLETTYAGQQEATEKLAELRRALEDYMDGK